MLCPRVGQADDELEFYPAFYPQEIKIDVLDAGIAAAEWSKPRVHAYLGADLFAGATPPRDAAALTSLRSYVVLTFDAVYGRYAAGSGNAKARCAVASRILPALAQGRAGYVFYPYPVTPYHSDYLEQFDLARKAEQNYSAQPAGGTAATRLRIRTRGPLAEALVPRGWKAGSKGWDATLEEVDIGSLVEPQTRGFASEAPWSKQGWFQAHRLYAQYFAGNKAGLWAEHAYRRLVTGDYRDDVERINLQRSLVSMLADGCERVVVGYTLRREYFNDEYSNGVEDVAFDSQAGLLSPIFPRSVKLKDFPWNGWLRIGVPWKPVAAWNPIGGFNDAFGRLLWLTVADPALLREPYGGSWMANRASVATTAADSSPLELPARALRPEEGTGLLRPVGSGQTAQQRLRYSVVTSDFHDGTATEVADLLYPYIFAFRWGAGGGGSERDPAIARSTMLMRDWLAGIDVIGIETQTRDFGEDLKFSYRVPVIDVYLNHRLSDPWLAAAVAPPWSPLPWEVWVLMEEAVTRGIAAFSEEEAQRRGIPWLDLVRDRELGARLFALADDFARQGYRPEALRQLVTEQEAQERWVALARFYAEHDHFLVTNGPYRLASWAADGVTLQVFRDASYPLGVGTFDSYALPLRAYISKIEDRGDHLEIEADVDRLSRAQRSFEITRVPLATSVTAQNDERPECRYVIVGPAGEVLSAGIASLGSDSRFVVDLRQLGGTGTYTVAAALFVGGNTVNPEIKLIEHRVASGATHRSVPAPRPAKIQ